MSPSPEDIKVTELIGAALATLKIQVIDHIIVGDDKFTSLAEKGLLFTSANDKIKEPSSFKEAVQPQCMAERMAAVKEVAKERFLVQKQNNPEKSQRHHNEREER